MGAISQSKFKRLLAYSAIGHIGFILLGLYSSLGQGQFTTTAILPSLQASYMYLIIYIIMSINTFAIFFSIFDINKPSNFLSQLIGLTRVEPVLAMSLALCILSIAGIPPLAGFYSKLLILISFFSDPTNTKIIVPILAVLISSIACFFYLRIVRFVYFLETKNSLAYEINKNIGEVAIKNNIASPTVDLNRSIIIGFTLFLQLTLIFYPQPLLFLTFDSLTNSLL